MPTRGGGRAPTRGAPTNCLHFSAKKPASSRQRPLEFATAHYDLHSSRRFAQKGAHKGGRAPTRGAPTNCLHFSAKKPASSRQRPLEFATAHYDLHSSRRFALRRAPTRGAPTRFRQPHAVLSQLDAIALSPGEACLTLPLAVLYSRRNCLIFWSTCVNHCAICIQYRSIDKTERL